MIIEVEQQILQSGKVPISRIVVGERKRSLGDIAPLAESIKELGLLNPITILPDGSLVAGYHRLEACRSLGWVEVDVHVTSLDTLSAELAEIDENLIRNELHWFDRDKQLVRRKEIYEQKENVITHGGDRKSKPNYSVLISSFTQDTASKIGKSVDTVQQSIQRATAFTEDQGKVLKCADVKLTDATKLARLEAPARAAVIETLAIGKASTIKEAKAVIKREERQESFAKTETNLDHYQIYRCGVESLCDHVAADSLDCIITDPPYPYEYLPLYRELSKFAQYALKPGGSLLVMVGQSYLPQVIHSLCAYMDYHWTLSYLTPGGQSAQLWQKKVNTFWKPLLWFTKGPYAGDWIGDVCKSSVNDNDKNHHHWGQSESGMADIVERFSSPGQIICDPFVGGGSTCAVAASLKRYFVGCDVDVNCVQTSLQRVQEVLRDRI